MMLAAPLESHQITKMEWNVASAAYLEGRLIAHWFSSDDSGMNQGDERWTVLGHAYGAYCVSLVPEQTAVVCEQYGPLGL